MTDTKRIISIHALLAESDILHTAHQVRTAKFLSTLSLRRATDLPGLYCLRLCISIHALLAESDSMAVNKVVINDISIHALLAESDKRMRQSKEKPRHFYPRSPCGERLQTRRQVLHNWNICIHALLAESDRLEFCDTAQHIYFYPRSPCGERLGGGE